MDYTAWMSFVEEQPEDYYRIYRIGKHLDKGETSTALSLRDYLSHTHPDRLDWIDFRISAAIADSITQTEIDEAW